MSFDYIAVRRRNFLSASKHVFHGSFFFRSSDRKPWMNLIVNHIVQGLLLQEDKTRTLGLWLKSRAVIWEIGKCRALWQEAKTKPLLRFSLNNIKNKKYNILAVADFETIHSSCSFFYSKHSEFNLDKWLRCASKSNYIHKNKLFQPWSLFQAWIISRNQTFPVWGNIFWVIITFFPLLLSRIFGKLYTKKYLSVWLILRINYEQSRSGV